MVKRGNGGKIAFSKNGSSPVESYTAPEWTEGTAYERDDVVRTEDTGDGTTSMKYWAATVDRTAKSDDVTTAAAADKAAELDTTYWKELEVGELNTLTSWEITNPVEQSQSEYLNENAPRVEYTDGATTIQLELDDNWEGDITSRVLEQRNMNVFFELFPKGKGTGLQVYKGNARVGQSSKSGRPGQQISLSATLAVDGDLTVEAQS